MKKVFLFFIFSISILFLQISNAGSDLPIFSPEDFEKGKTFQIFQNKKKDHHIKEFSLVNQNNQKITKKNLKGKIVIANFFFTTCPKVCPPLMQNIKGVHQKIKGYSNVMILSHSVNPETDHGMQLQQYAEKNEIVGNWHLLTGPKEVIYDLAKNSYLALLSQPETSESFIHTETVVLLDQQQRIRGFYNGSRRKDMDLLMEDIQILQKKEDSRV